MIRRCLRISTNRKVLMILALITGCLWFMLRLRVAQSYLSSELSWSEDEKRYFTSTFFKKNKYAQGSNPFDIDITIARLKNAFPEKKSNPIEKNILQMWSKSPSEYESEGKAFPYHDYTLKWTELNPDYNYQFFTNDELIQNLVKEVSHKVPEIIEVFQLLPSLILKSDLSRYLWIFINGGVYSDLDVLPFKSIDEWLSEIENITGVKDSRIGFIAGIESDPNFDNWDLDHKRRIQFLQWTFQCKSGHPLLARVIAKIIKTTYEAYYHDKLRENYEALQDRKLTKENSVDVLEWTGPYMFTDSIFEHFNDEDVETKIVDANIKSRNDGVQLYGPEIDYDHDKINWKTFTNMNEVMIIDDVAVLPSNGFRAYNKCERYCYAQHFFSGSWKQN